MQKEDRFFEGHHVRRCPFFSPKISAADVHFSAQQQISKDQKKEKVIKSADVHFSAQKQVKTKKKVITFAGRSLH